MLLVLRMAHMLLPFDFDRPRQLVLSESRIAASRTHTMATKTRSVFLTLRERYTNDIQETRDLSSLHFLFLDTAAYSCDLMKHTSIRLLLTESTVLEDSEAG